MAQLVGGLTKGLFGGGSTGSSHVYKATAVVRKTNIIDVTNVPASLLDNSADLVGLGVTLKLISSTTLDPTTKTGKVSKEASLENWLLSPALLATTDAKYSIKFSVDADFGVPGAFTVKNHHPNEFYLVSLTVELPEGGVVEFPCHSWIYNSSRYKTDRIFFSNQLCLPSDTPKGLLKARETDLKALRGDGKGLRQDWERVYDYDVYNDLSNPLPGMKRHVLGGSKEFPYPRRCRTGRPVLSGDETFALGFFYVPSDEKFSSVKTTDFLLADNLKALSQSILPGLESLITFDQTFDSLKEVRRLYDHGLDISKLALAPVQGITTPFELLNRVSADTGNASLLKFPVPQVVKESERGWMSDSEFGRQLLSGVNPMMIERLKEFPLKSGLDAEKYGPQESAITEEHIGKSLEGKTAQEALEENRLFALDYHDTYLPYIEKINSLNNTFAYATRTVLFLKSDGTLVPVAIELSTSSSRRIFVPPGAGEIDWEWELAKAHAATNDSGYHQLVSHWLRTHACIEPFIIATNRQLSRIHPLNLFLQPHFKNTMTINARARQALINAGGIIELTFSPGKYSIEMSSVVYRSWKFTDQGLPADLLKREMAVPDPSSKSGVKLVLEDYPYAADGLEIWTAIEEWSLDYVNACYKDDGAVLSDGELQGWWNEVITKGHADMKDEDWWPKLDSRANLASVLTTIIWIASAHHAAVNFGQYAYAGYMPNHPTATHKSIPEKESDAHKQLLANPEEFFLKSVSRKLEAIAVMLTVEILSSHASDEEYLGQREVGNWTDNVKAKEAFEKFGAALKKVEEVITGRNNNPELKNRYGAVSLPYTLLYPSSESNGITGRGVPNSISI